MSFAFAVLLILISTSLVPMLAPQPVNLGPHSPVLKKVYTGTIDISRNGDVIIQTEFLRFHWAVISVPEITLNDMPVVDVFVKPHPGWLYLYPGVPPNSWVKLGTSDGGLAPGVAFDEGRVYILYKKELALPSTTWPTITVSLTTTTTISTATTTSTDFLTIGNYMIVVVFSAPRQP